MTRRQVERASEAMRGLTALAWRFVALVVVVCVGAAIIRSFVAWAAS